MSRKTADRILTGATVWTGGPGEGPPRDGWGVALHEGRILAAGPADDLEAMRGPNTAVIHLEGRFLMPGFVDAHVHLQAGGLDLFNVDLRGAASPEELIRRVADRARRIPAGSWIMGGGWDEHRWGGELPRRSWLDRAAPDHPVLLLRTDMHIGVAGSLALRRAGIGPASEDPERGTIDREKDGEPTGILRERALELISRVVPPPSPGDRLAALRAASLHAVERGVTQVHDMGSLQSHAESWASLEGLRRLRRDGRLPLRVVAAVPIDDRGTLAGLIEEEGRGDERLGWGMVKGFVDGSLGARTAWFKEPYLDDSSTCGGPISDLEELERAVRESVELGLQPAVHAIGDRAVDWLLEVYAALAPTGPGTHLLPRVEHAQHLTPEGMLRVGAVPAHFSVQPAHLAEDGVWAPERIGEERGRRAYPFGTLLRRTGRLALGSDWTVAPMDPRVALTAAVTRRLLAEPLRGPWGDPGEFLTLEQALRAHTLGGAEAGGLASETGSLAVGKRADLAILSENPFHLSAGELSSGLRVDGTYVDGALVWQHPEAMEAVG